MSNKYDTPQSSQDPKDRPLKPTEQSNRDEYIQYQRERSAENSGTNNGLLIGSLLTALLGFGGFLTYYYYGNQSSVVPTTIINTPPISSPAASAPSVPEKQTKVIERTIEKAAPPQINPVDKPVPAPPKIIEVPKPVLVTGETKVIEVPKAFSSPMIPSAPQESNNSKPSSTPSTKASKSPEPVNTDLPSSPNSNNN